jgi:hypothetical protein
MPHDDAGGVGGSSRARSTPSSARCSSRQRVRTSGAHPESGPEGGERPAKRSPKRSTRSFDRTARSLDRSVRSPDPDERCTASRRTVVRAFPTAIAAGACNHRTARDGHRITPPGAVDCTARAPNRTSRALASHSAGADVHVASIGTVRSGDRIGRRRDRFAPDGHPTRTVGEWHRSTRCNRSCRTMHRHALRGHRMTPDDRRTAPRDCRRALAGHRRGMP